MVGKQDWMLRLRALEAYTPRHIGSTRYLMTYKTSEFYITKYLPWRHSTQTAQLIKHLEDGSLVSRHSSTETELSISYY